MHIILTFFEIVLLFLLLHFGVEEEFRAWLKKVSLMMPLSSLSVFQSGTKELYIFS